MRTFFFFFFPFLFRSRFAFLVFRCPVAELWLPDALDLSAVGLTDPALPPASSLSYCPDPDHDLESVSTDVCGPTEPLPLPPPPPPSPSPSPSPPPPPLPPPLPSGLLWLALAPATLPPSPPASLALYAPLPDAPPSPSRRFRPRSCSGRPSSPCISALPRASASSPPPVRFRWSG